MSVRRIYVALAMVIAATFLLPMAEGFAVPIGYTATTVSSGNTVTAEYFTVSTYQNANFDAENPVYSEPLSSSYVASSEVFSDAVEVLYTQSGSNYVINNTYVIAQENCYMAVINSKGTVGQYSATLQCELSDTAASVYGDAVSFMYKVADEANYKSISTPTTINSGTAYKLSIQMAIDYNGTTVPVNLTANISVVCSDITSGILHETCAFSVGAVSTNTGIEDIMEANGLNEPSITYGGKTYNLTDPDPNHTEYGNGTAAVRLSNDENGDGGIGEPGNGGVNLKMDLPSQKKFVIAIHYEDHNKTQKLSVKITVGSTDIFDQELQLTGAGVKYIYKYDDWEAAVGSNMPTSDSQWMDYWGDIRIDLHAANGSSHIFSDTKLDIVFKQS